MEKRPSFKALVSMMFSPWKSEIVRLKISILIDFVLQPERLTLTNRALSFAPKLKICISIIWQVSSSTFEALGEGVRG